jgi:predicted ATP-grasp superfamily ATP-dependent carboligase
MADPSLIMLQELIPGDAVGQFSFGALCADGQPLASIVAIRRRQHPVDFGRSSSYVESTEDAEIERLGRAVLGALRFNGLVEVEFKRDSRDGICKLLDINPRIWGWHTLGARAGVDFSYLAWQQALGSAPCVARARPGVRWVRALTDIPAAIEEVRAGRLSFRDYLATLHAPIEFAISARDDPMPALCEIPALLYASLKKRRSFAHSDLEGRHQRA